MTGDLGELLTGFNRMASQLENYDEANIEELKGANFNKIVNKLELGNSESTIKRLRKKLSDRVN